MSPSLSKSCRRKATRSFWSLPKSEDEIPTDMYSRMHDGYLSTGELKEETPVRNFLKSSCGRR